MCHKIILSWFFSSKIQRWEKSPSSRMCMCWLLSCVRLSVIPWTVACQAPPSGILQARILVCAESLQLYLTLCDAMDYSLPGSSVLGILQWVTIPFSKGSSWPRDWTQVSWVITVWATREVQFLAHRSYKTKQQSRLVLQAIVWQPPL